MQHCWEIYINRQISISINRPVDQNGVDGTDRNVGGSEEELSVEVGLLNGVHVSHNDLALPGCQSNHGKVFQQLTANGTGSNLE